MHTSAHLSHETLPPLPQPWPDVEYTGTLVQPAEARTGVNPDGMSVPMLCLLLELDSRTHNTLSVEQPFPVNHFKECEAAARRLKRGMRVTVQAPLVGMRLVARGAKHIHVISDDQPDAQPEETQQPCLL
jgi:hypothetical protein